MSSLKKDSIFPYHWYIDDKEKDVTCIRVYGIGEDGSIMQKVKGGYRLYCDLVKCYEANF